MHTYIFYLSLNSIQSAVCLQGVILGCQQSTALVETPVWKTKGFQADAEVVLRPISSGAS